jgi:hypothetical protein
MESRARVACASNTCTPDQSALHECIPSEKPAPRRLRQPSQNIAISRGMYQHAMKCGTRTGTLGGVCVLPSLCHSNMLQLTRSSHQDVRLKRCCCLPMCLIFHVTTEVPRCHAHSCRKYYLLADRSGAGVSCQLLRICMDVPQFGLRFGTVPTCLHTILRKQKAIKFVQ